MSGPNGPATVDSLRRRLGLDPDPLAEFGERPLQSITHDSRQARPGGVFACVVGANSDGHDFASQAVRNGSTALLVEHVVMLDSDLPSTPQLLVDDVRAVLGQAAGEIYGDPSRELDVIGVTGTSGKTTVTQMLGAVLDHCGMPTAVMGTLSGARTTPEAPDLQRQLREIADGPTRAVAMEVSSHALSLGRVDGTSFRAAVFTNLGHDHLDFHVTREAYEAAKSSLFTPTFTSLAIVNGDDPAGMRILGSLPAGVEARPYSLADAEDLRVEGPVSRFRWRDQEVVLRLAGSHNVSNALAVAAVAEHLGHDPSDIADGLCRVEAPRGRFEFVNVGQSFHVAVDYAHKPDALDAVLAAARQVAGEQRVIVVFGCGGDRDAEKRPMMGEVAGRAADRVFLTSDNPRSEDPHEIIAAIAGGLPKDVSAIIEPDRRAAIGLALADAGPGDVVLIAGKGHETVQEIGDQRLEFDDREVAIEALLGRETVQ